MVVSTNSVEIFRELEQLPNVNGFALGTSTRELIQDTYFDTSEQSLQRKRANLRLRRVNGKPMLTAKSDAKIQRGGVTVRREMEIPWTQNALKIVNQKMALGLVLRQPDLESVDDAIEQVRGHGLLMVQQRETERVKRRITNTGTHLPIAQLCLDTVLYHLNNSKVTLREIEIEAEKSADTKDITSIRDALESLYPAKLLRWPYGKFVTGKAIEKLSKLKQLNRLVDSEGLKLEAFEAIDRVIRSRNFQTLQNSN